MNRPHLRYIAWIEDTALGALLVRAGAPSTPALALRYPAVAPRRQDEARVPEGLKLRRQLDPAPQGRPFDEVAPLAANAEVPSDAAALGEVWTRLHEAQQGIFGEAPDAQDAPRWPEEDALSDALDDALSGAPALEEDDDDAASPEAPALGSAVDFGDDLELDPDDLPALPASAAAALEEALELLLGDERVARAFLTDADGELLAGNPGDAALTGLAAVMLQQAGAAGAAAGREVPFIALGLDGGQQLLAASVPSALDALILGLVLRQDSPRELATLGVEVVADAMRSLLGA